MTRNPNPSVRKNILPGLQVPAGLPVELEKFLQGVKEHLQVLQGILGQPKERAVTLADLERIGLIKTGVKGGRGEIIELLAPESSQRTSTSSAKMSSLADVSTTGLRPNSLLVYNEVTNRWEATDLSQLAVFADETAGLVPASGGGQDNFLRADGTWAEPPGSGGRAGALLYVNTEIPPENTVANTDAETAFGSSYTFEASTLKQGDVIRIKAAGVVSTDASSAPTLTLRVNVGTVTVLEFTSTLSTGLADSGWILEAIMVVQTDGETGALEVQGIAHVENGSTNLGNGSAFTIDTTGDLELTVTAQWTDSDEDNTISLRELLVYLEDADPGGASDVPDLSDLTFITDTDESATAPNSRQILEGANVELDDSVANQLTINAFPLHQKGAAWVSSSGAIETPTVDIPVSIPWNGTIVGVTVKTQGGPGDCVIDIWKDTLANFPPTAADTITASAKPTISSGTTYNDTTLTGWTKTVAAGDVLMFHLDSVATFTFISIVLDIRETE